MFIEKNYPLLQFSPPSLANELNIGKITFVVLEKYVEKVHWKLLCGRTVRAEAFIGCVNGYWRLISHGIAGLFPKLRNA